MARSFLTEGVGISPRRHFIINQRDSQNVLKGPQFFVTLPLSAARFMLSMIVATVGSCIFPTSALRKSRQAWTVCGCCRDYEIEAVSSRVTELQDRKSTRLNSSH